MATRRRRHADEETQLLVESSINSQPPPQGSFSSQLPPQASFYSQPPPESSLYSQPPPQASFYSQPLPEPSFTSPSHPSPPPAAEIPRLLAIRDAFLTIPLRSVISRKKPLRALLRSTGAHAKANYRIARTHTLNAVQHASLKSVLTVLNDNFPGDDSTHRFTSSITDANTTDDDLAALADTIDRGLIAFAANDAHTRPHDTSPASSTWSPTPRRCSNASTQHDEEPNADPCCLCTTPGCTETNIVPSTSHSTDFWDFIALFRGPIAVLSLKTAAGIGLLNTLWLCRDCRGLFAQSRVSLLPQVVDVTPPFAFPYDPCEVANYALVLEFPGGIEGAVVDVLRDDGTARRMMPGDMFLFRTDDAKNLPLPHPLLLQINVVCNRMVVLRRAAGYPVGGEGVVVGDERTEEKEQHARELGIKKRRGNSA